MTIGTILAFIVAALTVAGCTVMICGAIAGLVLTIREPKKRRPQ